MNKTYIWFSLLLVFWTTYVFASTFQLREALTEQQSSTSWPYGQVTQILEWELEIMYSGEGDNWVDNFFRWSYYDPAHGVFNLSLTDRVIITAWEWGDCDPWFQSYNIVWTAVSEYVGPVSFNHAGIPGWRDSVYICIPNDPDTWNVYLMGYTYSPMIWFQSFEWFQMSSTVEWAVITDADSRRLRVIGIATSRNPEETLGDQFVADVRVFWNISKVELRALMQRNVQNLVRNITPSWLSDIDIIPPQIQGQTWSNIIWTDRLMNNRVLYVWRDWGEIVALQWWNLEADSNKTLVVEWANIYIRGNIRWDGILWIIALQKNGQWWNIYIDPEVTDIHWFLYADRSVISYDWVNELDWSVTDVQLANQLYIKWVLFSENTIWGSHSTDDPPVYRCPFYVPQSQCVTRQQAMKYDLNFLRRYQIAPDRDAEGNIIPGSYSPSHGAAESFMWHPTTPNNEFLRPELREFPVILEYDNRIANSAPPLFSR